jgi:type I restriction enzyme S subunit
MDIDNTPWIKKIPKGWQLKKLGMAIDQIETGGTPSSNGPSYFLDDGVPWFTPSDIQEDNESRKSKRSLSKEVFVESNHKLIEGPAVLLVSIGATLGKVSFTQGSFSTNQQINSIVPKDDVDYKYLFYYFQSSSEIVKLYANTSTLGIINQQATKTLPFLQPPLSTQKAIATYLDERTARIDDLITAKHTLLDLLAERRAALITRAVTRGLDENVATRPSGVEWLGEIPVGWEVKRLRFLTSVVGGGTPTTSNIEYWKGDIPWVSPKDMKTGVIQKTQDFITDLGLASSPCALIAENTMIMVIRSGILRHSIPVALTGRPVTLNQDMKAFIPNRLVQSWFLYYVFHGLQKQLLPLLTKPGSTVESIEMQYLMDLEIPLPSVHLQNEIIQRLQKKLRQYETTQARIESSLHYLQEYRAALITAAVNGKLTSKFQ